MADSSPQAAELTEKLRSAHDHLTEQIGRVVVGQHEVVDQMLITLFCRGHAVLVGVPGLAKTLLVSTIAQALNLQFSRIQFTPDLMPSDITGTEVIDEDKATGRREMRYVKGPVFANVLLADEVNRTPPKTQAALLEAMQEYQVTAAGVKHELPDPFFVLATQNPIEQEGTYPLPEAQLDRFMFQITIGYPSEEEELEVIRRTTAKRDVQIESLLDADEVRRIQAIVREVPAAEHVMRYALRLVRATRVREVGGTEKPAIVRQYLSWGAGPRASQFIIIAAKARAILSGRNHVEPADIAAVAHPVLRHRLVVNFNAEADGVTTDHVIDELLKQVDVEGTTPEQRRELDKVIR